MASDICKFCLKKKDLVKSHIIPKSFFEIGLFKEKAPNKSLSILSNLEDDKPIRRPIGIYDTELFCFDCEKLFNVYDDYAYKLLVENRDQWYEANSNETTIFKFIKDADYKKLKLFLMSVLLRAGLSNDFFFQNVSLGPYIEFLKKAIRQEDPKTPEDFSVFLGYWDQIKRGPVIFPPSKRRLDGVNFYEIYLGRCFYHIKVDKRNTPYDLSDIVLKPNRDVIILKHDIKNFNAYDVVKMIINNPSNARYFGN